MRKGNDLLYLLITMCEIISCLIYIEFKWYSNKNITNFRDKSDKVHCTILGIRRSISRHFGLELASDSHHEDYVTSDQDDTEIEHNRSGRIHDVLISGTEHNLSDTERESLNENDTSSELGGIKQNCKCGQWCFSKFENSVNNDHIP